MKPLESVRVAKQCPASWNDMNGDDQVRPCDQCDRKVYNLSNMTREEATELISNAKGRMCVRYYVRPDGMVMTRDCGQPVQFPKKLGLAGTALAIAAHCLLTGCGDVMQGEAAAPPRSLSEIKADLRNVRAELSKSQPHSDRQFWAQRKEMLVLELEESQTHPAAKR